MRFGVCCAPEQASAVLAAGFDYVELPAKAAFEGHAAEATNLFVFTDLKLVGPSRGDIFAYGNMLIPKAASLGLQTMVVGSGNARRCPDGYDLDQAHEEFYEAAATFHAIASPLGITIAPESLRREETNVGNDLGDFARALSDYGVAFTCDTYHVLAQPGFVATSLDAWREEVPFKPAHVHLGTTERTWRVLEDPGLPAFVERLRELGYDGRVSYEGSWGDFEVELPEALTQIRGLFGV